MILCLHWLSRCINSLNKHLQGVLQALELSSPAEILNRGIMEKGLFWRTQEKMEAGGNGEVGQRREKNQAKTCKGQLRASPAESARDNVNQPQQLSSRGQGTAVFMPHTSCSLFKAVHTCTTSQVLLALCKSQQSKF